MDRSTDTSPSRANAIDWPDGFRALIADDEPSNLNLLKLYLGDRNITVDTATNGAEALELFLAHRYHVALLDLEMPARDGLETARLMRAHEAESDISRTPLLAFSGHESDEIAEQCQDAGFDHYVTKPIPRANLIRAIANACGLELATPEIEPAPSPQNPPAAESTDSTRVTLDADLRGLAPNFIGNVSQALDAARESLASNDREATRALFHRLKGTARMYGFARLGDLCAECESIVVAGELIEIESTLTAVAVYLNQLEIVYDDEHGDAE